MMLIQMRTVVLIACCLTVPVIQTGYGRVSAELLENDPESSEGDGGGKDFAKKVSREVLLFDCPQEMIAHDQF